MHSFTESMCTFRNTPRVTVWRVVRSGTFVFTFGWGLWSILVSVLSYSAGLPAISQRINFNISNCIISVNCSDHMQLYQQQEQVSRFKKSAPHLLLREEEGFIVSAELPGWQGYKINFNCSTINTFQTFKDQKTVVSMWWQTYLLLLFCHLV